MKKILLAIAIVLTIGSTVNAQMRDGFFSSNNDDLYGDRGSSSSPNILMPNSDSFGTTDNQSGAPLGSGLLILSALGAGYAVARKRNKE